MKPTISEAQAKQMGQAIQQLWQLIQYSLGQNQALVVALGTALDALGDDSPIPVRVLSELESFHQRMRHMSESLGQEDGFVAAQSALAARMGEQSPGTSGKSVQ